MNESNKNFRKRIGALAAAGVVGITGIAGIIHNKEEKAINDKPSVEKLVDIKLVNSYENNHNYYNENEIYDKYIEITERIDDENINKEEIIQIANEYIKISNSLKHLENIYENGGGANPNIDLIFSKLPGFDDELRGELVDLMVQKEAVLVTGNDFSKAMLASEYLYRGLPLEDMYIVGNQNNSNSYYVISKDNKLLFRIDIPENENDFLGIHPKIELHNIEEVMTQATNITNTNEEIPFSANIVEVDDLER